MSLPTIDVARAQQLVAEGAILVDVREPDERAREHIPGARHAPLSSLQRIEVPGAMAVIFHCRSGARTGAHAVRLGEASGCEAYLLEGGLEAWKRAGLPVAADRKQPIEIMRQVQIVAGSLVVLGIVLGLWVAPPFLAVSAFVGAGLVFAGSTGWCGMAKLLALMPWNRSVRKALA